MIFFMACFMLSMEKSNVSRGVKKVAVSGANGFIGAALVDRLVKDQYQVQAFVRNTQSFDCTKDKAISLLEPTTWQGALRQCSIFVHCAARAHIARGQGKDDFTEYQKVNSELTLALASHAALAGVRRFVFVSSVGVNGMVSGDKPFRSTDPVNPQTPYARSKCNAELGLREISKQSGMEVVVIRPPLVYGFGAPGNFGALTRWVARGLPIPLGCVTGNKRSFVALDNLVDLIVHCLQHPKAAGGTFLVSDGEDLSTSQLLQRMGKVLKKPAHLLYVPVGLLNFCAVLLGKRAAVQSLLGNLQVDISHTCGTLNWRPVIGVDEGLRRAIQGLINDPSV